MKLVGERGSIEVNGEDCTATITNALLEKRYGTTVKFNSDDLLSWIKRLKVWSTENGQITLSHWGSE